MLESFVFLTELLPLETSNKETIM